MEIFNSLANTAIVVFPDDKYTSKDVGIITAELVGCWEIVKPTVTEAGCEAPWHTQYEHYHKHKLPTVHGVHEGYSNFLIESIFPSAKKLDVSGDLIVECGMEGKALDLMFPTETDLAQPRLVVLGHHERPFGEELVGKLRDRYKALGAPHSAPAFIAPFKIMGHESRPHTSYPLFATFEDGRVVEAVKSAFVYKMG